MDHPEFYKPTTQAKSAKLGAADMKKILSSLAILLAFPAMAADTSVPNMTAGAAMSDTDLIYCAQSAGTTDRKCTGAQVKTYANTSAVRATTTTSEALANSDQNKLVTFSNGSAVACTIAQAGSGGNFAAGWAVSLKNLGVGTVTCTPTTSTVDGAANFTLTTGQGLDLYSDGTNYFTQPGKGSAPTTSASDLTSGTLAVARLPAFTQDCTTSAGSSALTCRQTFPTYIVNNWYVAGFDQQTTANNNSQVGNGTVRCYPAYFHGPATISALGVRINTTSAGGFYQVAVYANNAATGRPTGSPLASTGSGAGTGFSTTTGTSLNAAVSLAITGTPLLWWCSNSDNGTATIAAHTPVWMAGAIGTATQANLGSSSNALLGVTTPVAFGTWGDLTSATFTEVNNSGAMGQVHFKIGSVP